MRRMRSVRVTLAALALVVSTCAFEELGKAAEFIAQYEKLALTKPHFVIGAEGERVIAGLANVQPSMVNFLRRYIEAMQ